MSWIRLITLVMLAIVCVLVAAGAMYSVAAASRELNPAEKSKALAAALRDLAISMVLFVLVLYAFEVPA